jgi:hypothetical protein
MIVRNEAERLERCLGSVAGFVDEMVVVDTGSSDDTVAIAERCGATVRQIPWPGDFAPARNQALQWVRGDWVLVLDADEQLLPSAQATLNSLMARPELLLINLLRLEVGASQSPYSSVSRLFRRHPAIRWSGDYHAMVDASVSELLATEPHWRLADCPEPALHHDGYRPELLATGDKAGRLRRAMEAELARTPTDPYASAKLGALEVAEGHRARGIALAGVGVGGELGQPCRLLPQLLRHAPGADFATEAALQPQPVVAPLAAQLPTGQHRLHAGHPLPLLQGAVEEGEGQQHPGPCQGRTGLGRGQPAQAHGAEPLGQFKAAGSTQLQAVAAAAGRQAQARCAVPQEAEAIPLIQLAQQGQRVAPRQGQGQAQHPIPLQLTGALARRRQQIAEAGCDGGGGLHPVWAEAAAQMYGSCLAARWLCPRPSPRSSQAFMPTGPHGGAYGRRPSSGRCTPWR